MGNCQIGAQFQICMSLIAFPKSYSGFYDATTFKEKKTQKPLASNSGKVLSIGLCNQVCMTIAADTKCSL